MVGAGAEIGVPLWLEAADEAGAEVACRIGAGVINTGIDYSRGRVGALTATKADIRVGVWALGHPSPSPGSSLSPTSALVLALAFTSFYSSAPAPSPSPICSHHLSLGPVPVPHANLNI